MKTFIEELASKKLLITTSDWFIAPDGKLYKAVWGKVRIYTDQDKLGIKTNHQSTNWYAVIGESGKEVVVAGCQIKYACVSQETPVTANVTQLVFEKLESKEMEVENRIYIAE